MRRVIAVALLFCAVGAGAQTFRPEAIKGHLEFLANDLLEGREAGTRGYDVAAEYVAAQFEAIGLAPGASGGWFQPVPFRHTRIVDAQLTLRRPKGEPKVMKFGEGFLYSGDPLNRETRVSGDLAFVGYGITAPEAKHDDYAKLDARGKVVVIVNGSPSSFSPTLRAHYSSGLTKLENAIAHGAVGIINVRAGGGQGGPDRWERAVAYTRKGTMHWLHPDGRPQAVFPELTAILSVDAEVAKMLFERSGQTFEQAIERLRAGKARRGPLKTSIELVATSEHKPVASANVVGIVRGSDPLVANEYVVVTSHLDHIGITDPVDGDSINNGAIDNASGISIILETAREMVAAKPRRSVVFVATTGEEKGLRGADYFANYPTVKVGPVVANVNVDQVYLFAPTRDVTVVGAENSKLGVNAARAAVAMKLELSPDPFPEEVVFVRSDQYPFIRRGIPAVFVIGGHHAVDPSIDLKKLQSEWDKTRYHKPSDDLTQPIDYAAATQMAEYAYRMVLDVANADERPAWVPGDFFGEKFGKAAVQRGSR